MGRRMGFLGSRRLAAGFAALVAMVQGSAAWAQDTLSDPAGSGVIVSAVRWLAGHPARHCRHRRRGDRGRVGRLHDADRPDQLALRRDGDPRLLHPVRRGRHRRRHPVDGTAGTVMDHDGLERDPLFVALTRPQMFAGVTYSYFVVNAVRRDRTVPDLPLGLGAARGAGRPRRRLSAVPARAALLRPVADPGQRCPRVRNYRDLAMQLLPRLTRRPREAASARAAGAASTCPMRAMSTTPRSRLATAC